jgi:hypothetical protein
LQSGCRAEAGNGPYFLNFYRDDGFEKAGEKLKAADA